MKGIELSVILAKVKASRKIPYTKEKRFARLVVGMELKSKIPVLHVKVLASPKSYSLMSFKSPDSA